MKCLDKFGNKMRLSGGSLRNENILNSRELIAETFEDDASFTPGVYFWELGLIGRDAYHGREQLKIRLYDRSFSNANGVMVKFQTMYDSPVNVGDVIYNSKADEYLICTESADVSEVNWQGKFTLCNWILRWQDKNGDILDYPCHDINSTQYNSGEQSNRQFTIGSSQHILSLPFDKNTVSIKSPQRFFLDKDEVNPTSFIVTQNDTTSYNYGKRGIVKVTVVECASNSDTDRIDLGICDYFEKDDIKTYNAKETFASKSVIYYETTTIKSGGSPQKFFGKFFDSKENEITAIVPHWKIICDFSNALIVEEHDGYISIGIDNDDYVDEEFKIVLSDEEGKYSSSLIVRIGSLL